jgi:hypothetical protein
MYALWDGEVVARLDFEFAVLATVEIDPCRARNVSRTGARAACSRTCSTPSAAISRRCSG